MARFLKHILNSLIDFVYPSVCLICDAVHESARPVCPACWKAFLESACLTVHRGEGAFSHLDGPLFLDTVITGWAYTPAIEMLIHEVKYRRGMKLGKMLGDRLGSVLEGYSAEWDDWTMMPVPLHRVRLRERGYNQSERLCLGLQCHIPIPLDLRTLVRRRNTASQTKLSAHERQENVMDAFRVRCEQPISGRRILLVDDVITTGATMNSCAECLESAGAECVIGLALARPAL